MKIESPQPQSSVVVAAISGVLVYLVYFYSLGLPNMAGIPFGQAQFSRPVVLAISMPGLIPGAEHPLIWTVREMRHFGNLAQRIPILLTAVLLALAAGGAGDLALRSFPIRLSSERPESPTETAWRAAEYVVLAWGVGMSLLALGTLALGLSGWMPRSLIRIGVVVSAVRMVWLAWRRALPVIRRIRHTSSGVRSTFHVAWQWIRLHRAIVAGGVACALFLTLSLLGAMLPATDFDVQAYHLQGPKEYFLAGKISFSPHNVYANMPFATGMLSLLGMLVWGDWWWGGLVGQTLLAWFAPATAASILFLGRRCFGTSAGLLAALIYLSTPWIYRITILPQTENALAFFLVASVLAVRRAVDDGESREAIGDWLTAGFLAGSAVACKYTALISTAVPCVGGALLLTVAVRQTRSRAVTLFRTWSGPVLVVLGVLLVAGPWFVRNLAWTGNPTYPLLYQLFGGYNWTPEKNAKWEWGHRVALLVALGAQRPPPGKMLDPADPQHSMGLRQLRTDIHNVTIQSDWLSPLLFSLAPLALFAPRGRRSARWLTLLTIFLFFQWWLLTHRNDRFWVPMLPIVAVLAGAGGTWCQRTAWRIFLSITLPLVLFFNLTYCSSALCGYNHYAIELVPYRHPFDPTTIWLSQHAPAKGKVLAIGDVALFHYNGRIEYNTIFDDCWFADRLGDSSTSAEIGRELEQREIALLFINWSVIQFHRSPKGYGFSPHITPDRIRQLVADGILRRIPHELADVAAPVLFEGARVAPVEAFEVVRPGF